LPRVNAKLDAGTVIHATNGAPEARRHVGQWHSVGEVTAPFAR
jgi:hypothetical protein